MSEFNIPEDIVNRGLQHIGARFITALTDDSLNAREANACYNRLRRAELRRNTWRFSIRRTALRPITNTTQYMTFPAWAVGTTYPPGSIVLYDSKLWECNVTNVGKTPGADSAFSETANPWTNYFGSLVADVYATSTTVLAIATSYFSGELAIVPATYAGGTTYAINSLVVGPDGVTYISLASGNVGHTPASSPTYWAAWTTGTTFAGPPVYPTGYAIYRSLSNANTDATTTANWQVLSGVTVLNQPILYPLAAGPVQLTDTWNVYPLPNGYLRPAAQNPKAGRNNWLGGPSGVREEDWLYEGQFIVTQNNFVTVYRFVADLQQVNLMDDQFCEGLGCRVGLELCERLTQSGEKVAMVAKMYLQFMGEARTINGIEIGAEDPPLDDLIVCRV